MDRHSLPAEGRLTVVHAVDRHSLPAAVVGRHKKNVLILYFEHGPGPCQHVSTDMRLHALPHLDRRTVNEFPPDQDEKVSSVCACTEAAGTGFGGVCVERGGERWTKKMLNQTHQLTHIHREKLKTRQPTLVSEPLQMKRLFFPWLKTK